MANKNTELEEIVQTEAEVRTQPPKMYKVLLLNDDFTPMDFVILILQKFFAKSEAEAVEVMLHVHQKGFGIAGVYQYDIAETKVHQVNLFSKKHEHPLKCSLEAE